MAKFDIEFHKVIFAEGGYVNDKDDSGKETYLGISRRYNPKWSGWEIVDETKAYCKAHKMYGNIALTKHLRKKLDLTQKAKILYKESYWDKLELDDVPSQALAHQMFDTAVNCGIITAIRVAQQVLGMTVNGIWSDALKHNIMQYGKDY